MLALRRTLTPTCLNSSGRGQGTPRRVIGGAGRSPMHQEWDFPALASWPVPSGRMAVCTIDEGIWLSLSSTLLGHGRACALGLGVT